MTLRIRALVAAGAVAVTGAGSAHATTLPSVCASTPQARANAVLAAVHGDGAATEALRCGALRPEEPDLDPFVCPVTSSLPGTWAVVTPLGTVVVLTIATDGDVYVAGTRVWNCPPK